MKTAFIFDFDGTIGETIPLVLSAIESAYADMGLTAPSREVIQSNFGPNERGLCQRLFPDSKEKAETLYQRYLFHYEAQHDKFSPRPFTGIRVALKTLSENRIPIAIVTGKGDDSAKISLSKYDIVDLFSVIECGSERGAIKPEKIKAVLDAWKTTPEQTRVYYVGDAVSDVYDSLEAGVIPVSAGWSDLADVSALKKTPTTKIFDSVLDFRNWILSEII